MDWDRWEKLKSDNRLWLSSIPILIISILIWAGLGAFSITLCIFSLLLGIQFANWIAVDSNGQFLSSLIDSWLLRSTPSAAQPDFPNDAQKTSSSKFEAHQMPWEDIEVPPDLNESLESLLEHVVSQYVAEWYSSGIGQDRAFLNEIRYQLRYGCSKFVNQLLKIDLPTIVSEEAIPAAALHLHKIIQAVNNLPDKNIPLNLAENRICEAILPDLHYSMKSRQTEINYLRQVSDAIIPLFVDSSKISGRAHDDDFENGKGISSANRNWPSHSARHFLRELVVNSLLLPVLDLIADPDVLNNIIILAFDSYASPVEYVLPETRVPFLKSLTETVDNVPDSLLQLKLSEILRDARQFSMFRLYLQDIKGPVNELTFLSEATRIHESMQKKEESSSQISYDIWQLYGQFVHEGAPDQIPFDSDIVLDFKTTMQTNDMKELDRIIEKAYQVVYQHLQVQYVIPFCQSDSFLGYLCGSPPVSVIELIDKPTLSRKTNTTDRAISFNMFRSQLRRLLTLSTEGSIEGEEVVCDEYSIDPQYSSLQTPYELEKSKSAVFDKDEYSESTSTSSMPTSSSLPTIDISEDPEESCAESSVNHEEDDGFSSTGSAEVAPTEQPLLTIEDSTKNMNSWKVGISKVIPTRDNVTGRTIFIYVIDVERHEAQEHETKQWSIYRRFTEFYVLEAKLIEFHGDALRFSSLPPRKTFVTKNRAYLEQHRLVFSSFVSSLCKQRLLYRSDLLFTFLTSPDEFRDILMLSDLNPWKVVKKMPGKLSREKGQHLRPFLLNMLANTLAPPEKPASFKEKIDISSESSSISSMSVGGDPLSQSAYSSIYGNNCLGLKLTDEDIPDRGLWTRSPFDACMLVLHDVLSPVSSWMSCIFSCIRILFKTTIDRAIKMIFTSLFRKVYEGGSLVSLVQMIEQSLFYSDGTVPTQQEKSLREELMKRRLLEFIQEQIPSHAVRVIGRQKLRQASEQIVACLQYPRLNKQLSYILLDTLLKHLLDNLN